MGNFKTCTTLRKLLFKFFLALICCIGLFLIDCSNNPKQKHTDNLFLNRALNDVSDYYYVDLKAGSNVTADLPIGMFDSGTGGLTVLRALIDFDSYDNSNKKSLKGGDGKNDFINEQFIYFGDQANMPYGNYS
ncbi:MAG TPA: hypothetical protein VFC41_00335, partial [Anaerovoracaceae bacterium]|nr:hypothetical protein [Anaerovoracaceae bacterium]